MDARDELAHFLRTRRAAVEPAVVGLPTGPRRRTAGLRREEVALLAGVSVSWYTWLEQGRPINASPAVLDALARTLRLSPAEREHFFALATAGVLPPRDEMPLDEPPEPLARLLDAFDPSPAYVLGPRWEMVGWNRSQARLVPFLDTLDSTERNLLSIFFTFDEVRRLVVDWSREAETIVALFRAQTDQLTADPRRRELVDRLRARSGEFAAIWDRHDVTGFRTRLRRYHHPQAGELVFEYQQLVSAEWPSFTLVVQLGLPHDDSVARLAAWHRVV